jgi:hypothetical protein
MWRRRSNPHSPKFNGSDGSNVSGRLRSSGVSLLQGNLQGNIPIRCLMAQLGRLRSSRFLYQIKHSSRQLRKFPAQAMQGFASRGAGKGSRRSRGSISPRRCPICREFQHSTTSTGRRPGRLCRRSSRVVASRRGRPELSSIVSDGRRHFWLEGRWRRLFCDDFNQFSRRPVPSSGKLLFPTG